MAHRTAVLGWLTGAALALGTVPATASHVDADTRFRLHAPTPEQVAGGATLATGACAGCHGPEGVSETPGVPHLAGQRPEYLYMRLGDFRGGQPTDPDMTAAVRFLSEDALISVAAYYASRVPAPPAAKVNTPNPEGPIAAGHRLAMACAGCHGEDGNSTQAGTPSLTGQYPQYLVSALRAYREGSRGEGMMKMLVQGLSNDDFDNLALYYATAKPQTAGVAAGGDVQALAERANVACGGCHGHDGNSSNPSTPTLAGQDLNYLRVSMAAYVPSGRQEPTMTAVVSSLSAADREAFADYYAAQTPSAKPVPLPLSGAQWSQRCDRCHGIDGNSTDSAIPALAGQRQDYLESALRTFREEDRQSRVMHAMASWLDDRAIAQTAEHYATRTPRALVFSIPNCP